MNRRDIALAYIRNEVAGAGELTLFALRKAPENRISYAAMMAAREGLRRRERAATPPGQSTATRRLPIVTIDGKSYYRDDRRREHRAVDNPHDRLPL